MHLRPISNNVLVLRAKPETRIGSIEIPEEHREKMSRGEVLAVGPGRVDTRTGLRIPIDVKPGDVVLFGKYSGTDVKKTLHLKPEGDGLAIELSELGDGLVMMPDGDILAVIGECDHEKHMTEVGAAVSEAVLHGSTFPKAQWCRRCGAVRIAGGAGTWFSPSPINRNHEVR